MPTMTDKDVVRDPIAMSYARVVATANQRAKEMRYNIKSHLINVTEKLIGGRTISRVSYIPAQRGRFGGGVVIEVDKVSLMVKSALRGQ